MGVLCGLKVASFEEVVRVILTDGEIEDNRFFADFEKYDLMDAFWRQCAVCFGYVDQKPSLEKLVMTFFVTYTAKYVHEDLPPVWSLFMSDKPGNIMVFLDSLMNNVIYREAYDRLSEYVGNSLSAEKTFAGLSADNYVECDTFLCMDVFCQQKIPEIGRKIPCFRIMNSLFSEGYIFRCSLRRSALLNGYKLVVTTPSHYLTRVFSPAVGQFDS